MLNVEEAIEVTIDSGAVDTVGPPGVGKAFETCVTEASKAGRNFNAANGSVVRNTEKIESWGALRMGEPFR